MDQRKPSVITTAFIPPPEEWIEIGLKEFFQWFLLKTAWCVETPFSGGIPRSLNFRELGLYPCFTKAQRQVDLGKGLQETEKGRTTGPGPGVTKKNGILCHHHYVQQHPLSVIVFSECIRSVVRSSKDGGKIRKERGS